MKKTLTLLLAATGCAMASYSQYTETGAKIDINSLSNEYKHNNTTATTKNLTLVFNVDISDILANHSTYESKPVLVNLTDSISHTYNIGLSIGYYDSSSNSIEAYQYNGKAQTSSGKYIKVPSDADYYTISLTCYETIINEKTRIYWAPTLYAWSKQNDGTLKEEKYTPSSNWSIGQSMNDITLNFNTDLVDSVYVYNSVLTGEDLFKAAETAVKNSLNVPEPTTATLSLLALAGLAARRRRA